MKSEFKPDSTGLLQIDYMFCGFRCLNLIQKNYEYFNGFRIQMRQPKHPVKFGVYVSTSLKEYEHFVAHIVDTGDSNELRTYEIPINLMVNNNIETNTVTC
jgi:hypothetical protein